MKKTLSLLILIVFVIQTSACSSKTVIRASDPQAKIFVNGNYKGTGTAKHSDTRIIGSSNTVRIEKEGCQPQTYTFFRDEEFNFFACVGGVLVLFPFLWIMGYDNERTFDYECQTATTATPAAVPAAK